MKPDKIMANLLQRFNDYDTPIQMTAEEVREIIIDYFEGGMEKEITLKEAIKELPDRDEIHIIVGKQGVSAGADKTYRQVIDYLMEAEKIFLIDYDVVNHNLIGVLGDDKQVRIEID